MRKFYFAVVLSLALTGILPAANAADVFTTKNVGMEMARDLATEAILACRKSGYHVSAVVVDRHATMRAALRDDLASRFTIDIAEGKANAAIMAGVDSSVFRKNRADIRGDLNHIDGLLILEGAVLIDSAGSRIGAIGVSGAPGGDKDEVCAKAAVNKLNERLQFAE